MPAGVGPRVSKDEFLLALGLNPHDPQHEQYYRAMRVSPPSYPVSPRPRPLTPKQDEAILVYNRMNQDTSYLLDSVRNDPSTRPPFFWHHIRPERQRWAILEIWRNAGPSTRPLFDRGATSGEYGPNWVAGWLIYSVFRSRDIRNNRNRRKGEDQSTGVNGMLLSVFPCCLLVSKDWVGWMRWSGLSLTLQGNDQARRNRRMIPVRRRATMILCVMARSR